MKTNNNIPAYRFQGYTDAWELRKLGDTAIEIIAGGDIDKNKVVNDGKYPIYANSQNGDGIVGYYDDFYRVKGPAVTVTGRGEVGLAKARVTDFTPVVRLLAIRSNHNHYFLENAINLHGVIVESTGVPQLTAPQLSAYRMNFPRDIQEENPIGTFFSTLDQHITLHQRKLDTLKEQKKTYLKLLFPAKGQTKPALRFQGFEDDWEEVKLGELCDIRTGKLDANAMVENGEYDFYTSGIKKYRIDVAEFEGPAITIAGNGATVGYMHLADGKFNAYQRTYVLTNFKVDRSYIFSEIAKKLPIKIQQEARTGNIPYIVLSMLMELSISLPSLPEQEAIGTFFQNLDQEMAQVEDKLASLKEMKKTLLRKLFVS